MEIQLEQLNQALDQVAGDPFAKQFQWAKQQYVQHHTVDIIVKI